MELKEPHIGYSFFFTVNCNKTQSNDFGAYTVKPTGTWDIKQSTGVHGNFFQGGGAVGISTVLYSSEEGILFYIVRHICNKLLYQRPVFLPRMYKVGRYNVYIVVGKTGKKST